MTMHRSPQLPDAGFVRPFVVTHGRTVGHAGDIALETMVEARVLDGALAPDHAAVVDVCRVGPRSVMEIALELTIPIGVARVLVADLTATGHVEQCTTAETEKQEIVERLLAGLRAL
ncbi:MAG: DUF742 domain-containing protein [Actinomycetota bacterium]